MASYTISSGDTLSAIAAKNGLTLQQLIALNPQYASNPNLIYPGQTVNLSPTSSTSSSSQYMSSPFVAPTTSGTTTQQFATAPTAPKITSSSPTTSPTTSTTSTAPKTSTTSGTSGSTSGVTATTPKTTATSGSSPTYSSYTGTPQTPAPITPSGIPYDPAWAKYGITQDIWNSMNATQQGMVGASLEAAKGLYGANASNVTLQQALAAAAKDPNIIAKYSDALKMDRQVFAQNIQQIQQSATLASQQQQTQFENERKALAEQSAAAGQAYSGFRGRAQAQLGQQESGIIQSTRSQIQNQLNQATSAFESKYGTSATNPASINFNDPLAGSNVSLSGLDTTGSQSTDALSGQLAGGITGSQPIAQQQDINSLASNYVSLGQMPPVTPA